MTWSARSTPWANRWRRPILYPTCCRRAWLRQAAIMKRSNSSNSSDKVKLNRDAEASETDTNIDKRGRLDDEIFSYRESKDKVFIFWYKKQVMILKGQQARKF